MDLFYRDLGKGAPLLFIHGLYGCSDNWLSIARQLSMEHRIIIPDLRNHGKSLHSDKFSYSILINDILSLLKSLNIDKISIAGHSMGGKIAMALAQNYPTLIDKLIIIDIAPIDYNQYFTNKQKTFHYSVIDCFHKIKLENIHSYSDLFKQLEDYECNYRTQQLLAKNLHKNKDKSFEWKLNFKAIESNLSNILDNNLSPGKQYSGECVFIKGEQSDYISNEVINNVNNYFPKANIISIPEAGHWIHSEQPDRLIQVLKQALL